MPTLLSDEREAWRLLKPFLAGRGHKVAITLVTGLLLTFSEGLGMGLFLPLLHQFGEQGGGFVPDHTLGRFAENTFGLFPEDSRLLVICVCLLLVLCATSALTYLYHVLGTSIETWVGYELRKNVIGQYFSIAYAHLEQSRQGHLLNTLYAETWKSAAAIRILMGLSVLVVSILVHSALLMLISWQMTIVVLTALFAISWVVRRVTRKAEHYGERFTQHNATLTDVSIETMNGMKTIRAFGREQDEIERYDRASNQTSRTLMDLTFVKARIGPIYDVVTAALLVTVAWVSIGSQTDLVSLVVFIFVLSRLQPKLTELDLARNQIKSLLGPIREVDRALSKADKVYTLSGDRPYQQPTKAIRFDGVCYSYPGCDELALNRVSFSIEAGRTTAIVGPSGSGKSTLVKLLLRFCDPTAGRIWVDDQHLETIRLSEWRDHLALVSQDLFLFNTTVRENIAYASPDATEEQIRRAARAAHAGEFIDALPDGYDTLVGDRGTRLSGGQVQRLTLARAELRSPDLLILDEATNALDGRSEDLVLRALKENRHERTMLVVAHRLSTIAASDHVVVLDGGRVLEEGPPSELLQHGRLFKDLFDREGSAERAPTS